MIIVIFRDDTHDGIRSSDMSALRQIADGP